jgi:lipopolysaccharide assembly outer membrane protein LptD (OstA)
MTKLTKSYLKQLIKEELKYYNSHGYTMTWKHMKELEVYERGNYKPEEVKQWEKKYNIKDTDKCIWVTKNKRDVKRYLEYDNDSSNNPISFERKQGFIIPESNDGDGGFLFVLKK